MYNKTERNGGLTYAYNQNENIENGQSSRNVRFRFSVPIVDSQLQRLFNVLLENILHRVIVLVLK